MRWAARAAGAFVFLLAACTAGHRATSTDLADSIPVIVQGSDDPSVPYGIVAIDYHFHDAHPSIPLASNRDVTITNEGSVTHNVTFPQLGYSKDIPAGSTISIQNVGEKLGGPGTYDFFCRYHSAGYGMIGTIVIASVATP